MVNKKTILCFINVLLIINSCPGQEFMVSCVKVHSSYFNNLNELYPKQGIWDYSNSPFSSPSKYMRCDNTRNFGIELGYKKKKEKRFTYLINYQYYNFYEQYGIKTSTCDYVLKSVNLHKIGLGIRYNLVSNQYSEKYRLIPYATIQYSRMIFNSLSKTSFNQFSMIGGQKQPHPDPSSEVDVEQGAFFFFIPQGSFYAGLGLRKTIFQNSSISFDLLSEVKYSLTNSFSITYTRFDNAEKIITVFNPNQRNLELGFSLKFKLPEKQ